MITRKELEKNFELLKKEMKKLDVVVCTAAQPFCKTGPVIQPRRYLPTTHDFIIVDCIDLVS